MGRVDEYNRQRRGRKEEDKGTILVEKEQKKEKWGLEEWKDIRREDKVEGNGDCWRGEGGGRTGERSKREIKEGRNEREGEKTVFICTVAPTSIGLHMNVRKI